MGDAVDKLIALSTEHVKAYTKKDGTRVEAHTRTGGKFSVKLPDGSKATRSSKTHSYTHAVQVTDSRGTGIYRWSGSMKSAEAGRKEALKYGFKDAKIVSVEREEDAPKASTPSAVKTPEKSAQSAVEALKSKTGAPPADAKPTKSVNYFKDRHPTPAEGSSPDDRQLQLWSDGKYRWRYFVNGKWIGEWEM